MLAEGISFIPSIGSHTQKIPPTTSVKESKVRSAAGINFDPIEYKIKPKHTKVPCNANKLSFLLVDIIFKSFEFKMNKETTTQNKPAIATVVNLGVFFFHLNVTEKIEKPTAEASPNNNPVKDPKDTLPNAIIATPIEATTIDIQTPNEICSFKKRKPNNAVMKGLSLIHI